LSLIVAIHISLFIRVHKILIEIILFKIFVVIIVIAFLLISIIVALLYSRTIWISSVFCGSRFYIRSLTLFTFTAV
jgi:hypothetical protein